MQRFCPRSENKVGDYGDSMKIVHAVFLIMPK